MSNEKIVGLPRFGEINLEGGKLVCRDQNAFIIGEIYVGPNGKLVIDGIEVLGVQKDDPWKITGAISHDSSNRSGLILATGETRGDGVVDETAYVKFGRAEDCKDNDLAGQFEVYIRPPGQPEPQIVAVCTTAYSEEKDWIDVAPRTKSIYFAVKNFVSNLWKFNTQPVSGNSIPIPPSPIPITGSITSGVIAHTDTKMELIANGDFIHLESFFGFESEDHGNYLGAKMTWQQVVNEMERRWEPTDPTA